MCPPRGECRCAALARMSDLDALLARPGFRGGLIDTAPDVVGKMLPLLDDTVAITVAGPVAVNDSGKSSVPTVPGDPLVCAPGLVSLRLNVASLGSVVTTEAEQHIPPTLRMFDIHGSSSHTTYLTRPRIVSPSKRCELRRALRGKQALPSRHRIRPHSGPKPIS